MWSDEMLTLTAAKPLEAFVSYAVSFNVTNPAYSQPMPPIYLTATGLNFTIASTLVTHNANLDSHTRPMYVGGFEGQFIQQSDVSQGACVSARDFVRAEHFVCP